MKPITKFYLKSILRIGIPYGIIMTVIEISSGGEFVLWKFFALSIFFGGIMSLVLIPFHISELKRLGIREFSDEILTTNQEREFPVIISKEELIYKLMNDPATKNMNLKESGNLVILKTKPSWRSWGEKIHIKLENLENGVKHVIVSSKPKLSITFVDYGKNRENIDLIEKLLMKTL